MSRLIRPTYYLPHGLLLHRVDHYHVEAQLRHGMVVRSTSGRYEFAFLTNEQIEAGLADGTIQVAPSPPE